MSGVTTSCPDCGRLVTVMCGSPPGRCNDCFWKDREAPKRVEDRFRCPSCQTESTASAATTLGPWKSDGAGGAQAEMVFRCPQCATSLNPWDMLKRLGLDPVNA